MAKISHIEKSKIYRPRKKQENIEKGYEVPPDSVNKGFEAISGRPLENIESVYKPYLITDNKTNERGNVVNRLDSNVVLAKQEVDANEK